jgi:hypothetical protein
MIQNYTFNKKIKKNGPNFQLELILPNNFNNIEYKIYGEEGFVHYGIYTSVKNIVLDNVLIIIINKLQNLFINIKSVNEETEYFDFLNIYNNVDNLKKNIKIDIKRKISGLDDQTNIFLDNIISDKNENLNNKKDLLNNEDDIIKKNISTHDLFNYFVKKDNKDNDSSDEDDTDDDAENDTENDTEDDAENDIEDDAENNNEEDEDSDEKEIDK